MATYSVDWFTTRDGFGSGPVAFWGKEGPELLAQRDRSLGNPDQTLVLGAEHVPPHGALGLGAGRSRLRGPATGSQDRDLPDVEGPAGLAERVLAGLPGIDLELIDSRQYDGRIQQLVYVTTLR